jgi:hypothetical protein
LTLPRSIGLPRPAPEVELVVVLADLAIAEHEARLNIIDHGPATLAEQVGGHPMGATAVAIAANLIEGQREPLRAAGEQAPHVSGILADQGAEDRVVEHHVIAVAGRHGLAIQALKGAVERVDQGFAHGVVSTFIIVRSCIR